MAAAAVLSNYAPLPSSSRTQQPSSSSTIESSSKPFNRLRSTLEQTMSRATRSKKPSTEDFATVTPKTGKGKEKAVDEKPGMLRRLESKVNFRRSVTPSPLPPPLPKNDKPPKDNKQARVAGITSFITPSLRQASISSPALHLSSQAFPSPKSQSNVPASSSSTSAALVSPPKDNARRSKEISRPLSPKEAKEARLKARHKSSQSQPINIPSSSPPPPSTPPDTPKGRHADVPSPPDTPTPPSRSRSSQLGRLASTNRSTSQLPLGSPPSSPSQLTPRNSSPIRPRSPSSSRNRVVTPIRGLSSSSTSHLPLGSNQPPSARKPSLDSPRRPSLDSPRRPSIDASRRTSGGLAPREESPSPVRPRPRSPSQRSYAQNRHYNISSSSLISPSNPEHRELIRTATSMLCKEILKPPPHMARTESGLRDWEEVDIRTQSLARLERIWNKSGFSSSSTNLGSSALAASSSGEERERRLFCEAIRDGYVLCQLMNKLRSSSIVKPDPLEDGFRRTSNVTKFLAACSSYGLPNEELFHRDDLIEATSESLSRVAKTIIALIKFVDAPIADRSRIMPGQIKKPTLTSSPYGQRAGSTSSPNLLQQPSTSPVPSSPIRKRYGASGLPTVRSNSPGETVIANQPNSEERNHVDNGDRDVVKEVPKIMPPPPRSPLRNRAPPKGGNQEENGNGLFTWAVNPPKTPSRSSVADSTRASIGDASVRDSLSEPNLVRQSVASSALTDSTTTTMLSSLLEVTRSTSAAFNKFGTIRTVTTEATSETPSITRTEGSSIVEELTRKRGFEKYDSSVVDLSRVVEEAEESGASSRGGRLRDTGKQRSTEDADKADKMPAIRLGKGKWPDDFLDIQTQVRTKNSSPDSDDPPYSTSPISISPPRKLAIVGAQVPRRPSHRARHSLDAPVLAPKEPALRRDVSPESGQSRIMLRRHSTKPLPLPRNGGLVPRGSLEDSRGSDSSEHLVPFPRTPSGEHPRRSPSPRSDSPQNPERPRLPRGRFQSDIEGSKRRPRPSSYDELGVKPTRSRFESMVNLGVASSNASASDLIHRESMDGSAVRKTLIIKEEGKPPTHFQLGNCIGRGQFGSVYRALNLNTGQMVAVKRIRLEGLKEDEVTTLMREVDLVKSLSHPSIVKYEGMARDNDTLSIVLEYAENGSLGQTLKAFGRLNERLVASYVVKILEGLHYLHQCDVVHCDLKAANILTTKNGNVKLSDFGVSLNMRAVERDIKDVAGTPNWMAPEVIELKGASPKSDIWSLACTVIELLTGKPPYADIANGMSVMFRIVEDDMPPLPEGCSAPLRDFLTDCFNKDPVKRPSAELLCEHDWLKQNWGLHKELRPQDSIPFLRRVSADLQKSDAVRYLASMDIPDSPATDGPRTDDVISGSPPGRRLSNNSLRPPPLNDSEISPREHTFVKTTFSKPMLCRVCLLNVKKSAVLCAQCSLISHAKCAVNAPPTCDLRAQLLLYAQYAQNGNPASAYSNPADQLDHPKSPMSDVSYVAHTPRTSFDVPRPPLPPATPAPGSPPPTSYKFMGAFKRSKSPEPGGPSTPSSSGQLEVTRPKVLVRKSKDRPQSLGSNSTNPTSSSVRSTTTTTEAHSTNEEASPTPRPPKTVTSATSAASDAEHDDDDNRSVHWRMPGDLSNPTSTRHKKSKSSTNCAVQ